MKIPLNLITINKNEFQFFLVHNKPIIFANNKAYSELNPLLQDFPFLKECHLDLIKFAKIVNFLSTGIEFKVIEDIDMFKNSYSSQVSKELKDVDKPRKVIDSGISDVNQFHKPRIDNNSFVFFVKDEASQIPYKVEASLSKGTCSYSLNGV